MDAAAADDDDKHNDDRSTDSEFRVCDKCGEHGIHRCCDCGDTLCDSCCFNCCVEQCVMCNSCARLCASCGDSAYCHAHADVPLKCFVCRDTTCDHCLVVCPRCNNSVCVDCWDKASDNAPDFEQCPKCKKKQEQILTFMLGLT